MSNKKLFEVAIDLRFFAYADTHEEAEAFADDAVQDAFLDQFTKATEVRHRFDIDPRRDDGGVYHSGAGVLRLADLVSQLPPKPPPPPHGPAAESITHADLFSFLHCSINYALGRQTYVVGVVCDQVMKYWTRLAASEQHTLLRNLKADIESYDRAGRKIGDDCDDKAWRNLLAFITKMQKASE